MMPQLIWDSVGYNGKICKTILGVYILLLEVNAITPKWYLKFDGIPVFIEGFDDLATVTKGAQEHFEKQCLKLVQEPAWMKVNEFKYRFIWDGETVDVRLVRPYDCKNDKEGDLKFFCQQWNIYADTIEEMKAAIHKHIANDILSKLNLIL